MPNRTPMTKVEVWIDFKQPDGTPSRYLAFKVEDPEGLTREQFDMKIDFPEPWKTVETPGEKPQFYAPAVDFSMTAKVRKP